MKEKKSIIITILIFVFAFAVLVAMHYPFKREEEYHENIKISWDDDKDIYEIFIVGEKRTEYVKAENVVIRYDISNQEQLSVEFAFVKTTTYRLLDKIYDNKLYIVFE